MIETIESKFHWTDSSLEAIIFESHNGKFVKIIKYQNIIINIELIDDLQLGIKKIKEELLIFFKLKRESILTQINIALIEVYRKEAYLDNN